MPTHPSDDQFYRCIDVRNPSKPVEIGRWWMPGTRQGDNVMPPPRHPLDKGHRAHNTNVYPQRPDRLYLAYIDGGMFILDIAEGRTRSGSRSGPTRRRTPASCIPWCRFSTAASCW